MTLLFLKVNTPVSETLQQNCRLKKFDTYIKCDIVDELSQLRLIDPPC